LLLMMLPLLLMLPPIHCRLHVSVQCASHLAESPVL
jgi:hypothetical protein